MSEAVKPKIPTPVAILLVIISIICDLLNWIPILNWIIGLIRIAITQIYFRYKGVKGIYDLVGVLIDFIPAISVLPTTTAGILVTIWIDRHPKGTLAKTSAVAQRAIVVKKPATGTGTTPKVDGVAKAA